MIAARHSGRRLHTIERDRPTILQEAILQPADAQQANGATGSPAAPPFVSQSIDRRAATVTRQPSRAASRGYDPTGRPGLRPRVPALRAAGGATDLAALRPKPISLANAERRLAYSGATMG